MKKHQVVFEKIKVFLDKHFGGELNEYEDGSHLAIGGSNIWISYDEKELTIGYGLVHRHYDSEYDDLTLAVDQFFNLLTRRKRITDYLKGNVSFKHSIEIELDHSKYEVMGTARTWLFPYWKKTKERISFEDKVIDRSKIAAEIKEIRSYAE